jgi:hypothetical protein
MRRLLDDQPMRTAFGMRSRQIFHDNFELDRCVDLMVAFYQEVVDTKARHPHRVPAPG